MSQDLHPETDKLIEQIILKLREVGGLSETSIKKLQKSNKKIEALNNYKKNYNNKLKGA